MTNAAGTASAFTKRFLQIRLRSFSDGTKPNTIATSIEVARVNSKILTSSPISSARGKASGIALIAVRVAHTAKSNPAAPPAQARRMLSVSNCLMARPCVAPSAARIANSRARPVERARSKLATFAQAISSTNPTAPSNTNSIGATSPTMSSLNGFTNIPVPLFTSGYASARFRATESMSKRACASVTSGFILAIPIVPTLAWRSRNVGSLN